MFFLVQKPPGRMEIPEVPGYLPTAKAAPLGMHTRFFFIVDRCLILRFLSAPVSCASHKLMNRLISGIWVPLRDAHSEQHDSRCCGGGVRLQQMEITKTAKADPRDGQENLRKACGAQGHVTRLGSALATAWTTYNAFLLD